MGTISTEEATRPRATGPILRSTGYAWDLRRDLPYLYDDVDFDVIVSNYGDSFDRYAIRLSGARVDADPLYPVHRAHARATTASRTRRSPRRRGPASTSRWKR
ncbi:MAG: hypothetical protein R2711_11990 [Acidimicrobiales bacterium]